MNELADITALVAILGIAVVYGTDVFCALVLRPALARVDDQSLVSVMGSVHRYGDKRMPLPGVVGLIAAAASTALAAASGHWVAAAAAGTAVVLLFVWLAFYLTVSKPINQQLTAAAETDQVPSNARWLQHNWDRIIIARAVLQGLATAAMCVALLA